MSSLQRSRSLRKPTTTTSSVTPASTSTSTTTTAKTSRIRAAATATPTETSRNTPDLSAPTDDAEPRHGSPSRLPVKPLTRSATAASIASSTSTRRTLRSGSTASKSTPTPTPTSTSSSNPTRTNGLSRSSSLRQPSTAASQEPPKRDPTTTRYPPSTTTTRNRTVARPTSSDGNPPTQTKRLLTHTRARSTTTVTAPTAPSSALRNTPILRPASGGSSTSSSSSTTTRTITARKVSSGKERLVAAQPRLRPAFSTLQQHYSPAKSSAPKPLTSTFLAPPSPSKLPANVAASAETSKLQTELLQLHLLHRDSAVVDVEWRASAKQKLGERFTKVAAEGRRVDEQERAEVERENVLALRSWAMGGGLEERIQTLDTVINGVWTLGEPGGRYARVVRRFERWVDRMCEIEDARRGDAALLQEQDVLFIGELDAAWKDECTGLIRRLDGIKRHLEGLGYIPEDEGEEGPSTTTTTSLKRMVDNSRTLVEGMLAELSLMEEIEREALAREDDWIRRMNRDNDDDVNDTPRAGAIWRVV
ncbi:hypothetical protein BGZ63DRAFT_348714 [Mariannaea sp. PMI_226]|nr:hypothetical protein BGZ63DRAFT_348714 [Mariannaea sp. PMI_226]